MEQNLKPVLDDADIEAYVRCFIACGIIKAPKALLDLEQDFSDEQVRRLGALIDKVDSLITKLHNPKNLPGISRNRHQKLR